MSLMFALSVQNERIWFISFRSAVCWQQCSACPCLSDVRQLRGLSAKDVTACFVSLSSFLVNGGSDSVSWTGSITAANRTSPSTQLRHAPGETYYISFIMSFQHTSIYCDLYYIFWPVIYIRSLLNRSILSLVIWFITSFIMIGLYYFHFM